MIYYHLRQTGQISFNQLGMNVKTTITEVQNDFFHQRILLKNENYQSSGLEIIPDITFFSERINHDWRRRNFENTLKETIYSLEVKASERHKSRLRQLEIQTDIQKLIAQRQETQRLYHKRIGVGMFIIDVAPDPIERMKESALAYIVEFAKLNEVDIWYFNQDSRIEALA